MLLTELLQPNTHPCECGHLEAQQDQELILSSPVLFLSQFRQRCHFIKQTETSAGALLPQP